MGKGVEAEYADLVVWQARPSVRTVLGELAVCLLLAGVVAGLHWLIPPRDPWLALTALLVPVLGAVRSLVTAVRGRVVLGPDGIEVRRVLTRRYPWASLLSVDLDEDGRIEVTPKGWVRKLPVPKAQVEEAFAIISSRWTAATTGETRG